jgi:hypothetical protein
MYEMDLWKSDATRVAGRERWSLDNSWFVAEIVVEAHTMQGYPWSASCTRKDINLTRVFKGFATTRRNAQEQAHFKATQNMRDVVEGLKDYERRKRIYEDLSVRAGVPLAVSETVEQVRRRQDRTQALVPTGVGPDKMLTFAQERR